MTTPHSARRSDSSLHQAGRGARLSVIIPTWNEATTIQECLSILRAQAAEEVIVADAGSPDGTASLAEGRCTRVVPSRRGRGAQQNAGAAVATGDILLFLHADCRLAPGALETVRDHLQRNPRCPGGCLRMRVDDRAWLYRMIDAMAHLRAGVLGIPYGDQGLFVTREAFNRVGGFPETPLMEDVLIALRLRRYGRLCLLSASLEISARRWRHQGIIRQTLRNWALTILASLGVPPTRLARYYPAIREAPQPGPLAISAPSTPLESP